MFRKLITVLLLAFVASSVFYLVYDELTRASGTGAVTSSGGSAAEGNLPRTLTVYYFWEAPRCDTCLKLEGYAEEALRNGFSEELKSGLVRWRPVNVGEPAGEHFVKDYELFTKALIISDVRHGKEAKWKNLEAIWDLVGDKGAYIKYVQGEVAMALKEVPGVLQEGPGASKAE
jgi:hypothetical protein